MSVVNSDAMEYARTAEFERLKGLEGRVTEELRGAGQLALPDGPAAGCAFGCAKLDDGRVVVECHLLAGSIRQLIHKFGPTRGDGQLKGRTAEGSDIVIEGAALTHLQESVEQDEPGSVKMLLSCNEIHLSAPGATCITPVRVTYGLTNLEFLGDERTHFPSGGWALDTFRVQVASREIAVKQTEGYRESVRQMKSTRGVVVTAEATVQLQNGEADVPDLRYCDDMMDVVCTLLSLAKGNRIAWIYAMLWDKDGKLISKEWPGNVEAPWRVGGALIGGTRATQLKEFVAHSYEPYLEARDRFNLPVAVGYYLASKSETEMFTKFLLASTAMETLVSNFAEKRAQGDLRYIVPEHDFNAQRARLEDRLHEALGEVFPGLSDGELDDARVKVGELNRRSFRRVLKRMLNERGVQYDKRTDLQFMTLRHAVVHTGVLGMDIRESFRHYSTLIELLDRIFLRILEYEGEYEKYSDQLRFISR